MTATGSAAEPRTGLFTTSPVRYDVAPGTPVVLQLEHPAVGRTVRTGDELAYAIHPDSPPGVAIDATSSAERLFDATAAVVDVRFDDGRALSSAAALDQHGIAVEPAAAYRSKRAPVDEWTLVRIDLSPFAGAEIVSVELIAEHPGPLGAGPAGGLVEVVALGPREEAPGVWATVPWAGQGRSGADAAADVDAALTTRGTHSTAQLSHGLTLPATAMPFGFHFLNPVTDASTWRQAYTWHTPLDDEARPSLQAMALSHTPSPWIGDRGVVQVFPAGADGSATRAGRARAFCHRDEVALPHRYTVTFADGLAIDGAATQHAALLDIRFDPASIAAGPGVVFDQVDDRGELDLSQATKGVLRMVSRGASEETVGSPPVHAIARLRPAPIAASAIPGDGRPSVHGVVRFPPGTRYVTIWLATSFIDPEQAERNLGEVAPDDTVATVAARARDAWRELLSLVRVDSADEEHRVTLASNLYRMFLYPSVTHEIGADGRTRHAVVATDGAVEVRDGERSANNGFWDTYRTIWPALLLLRPREAAQLLDGFVEHFTRDGWMPRWSAPGPVDCMVGTSSDNVIADALAACVDLGDELGAYDSMLRNATTVSSCPAVGRKGLSRGIFRGYIDRGTPEGLSWSLENAISDSAIANAARRLGDRHSPAHPRARQWRAEEAYFRRRAAGHALVFDPATGFYRGRNPDGTFDPSSRFDPESWGGDYTETNAWGMRFTAPHDGAGLAHLHGGPKGLGRRLDEFFAMPERATPDRSGGYGGVIHEMTEARNVRMGMFGPSNQPAHHIPFMYAFSDRPHAMDPIVRDCVRRLFRGWEIGKGYPGDEDNGEMSAWWLWLALGLYPLSSGADEFVVCAPSFDAMSIDLGSDREITVRTSGNAPGHDHIQSVLVNGTRWTSRVVPGELVRSGCIIDIKLGERPVPWEQGETLPTSVTPPGRAPRPWTDVAATATVNGLPTPTLVDDSGDIDVVLATGAEVEIALECAVNEAILTLSSGTDPADAPVSFEVLAMHEDGRREWVAEFPTESFRWPRQTRPFLLRLGGARRFVLHFPMGGVLRQIELCPDGVDLE